MGTSRFVAGALPHQHYVQLYQADERSLVENVGSYIRKGLERGESALVISGPDHAEAFSRELQRSGTETAGRVLYLDARETLSRFMTGGHPDPPLFEDAVREAVSKLRCEGDESCIRAYGEMVGILWQAGEIAAAIRLEELWNGLLGSLGVTLFCGYPIDIFGTSFEMGGVDAVLCAHTHLLPTGHHGTLDRAVSRALREVFGSKLEGLKFLMKTNFRPAWGVVPNAEGIILWLRRNLPDSAADVLARARCYYAETTGVTADA